MKRRFELEAPGLALVDRHGWTLNVVALVVDVPPEIAAQIEAGGEPTEGGSTSPSNSVVGKGSDELPSHSPSADARIDRVWDHYVAVMKPRKTTLPPQERAVIRDALKVAEEHECCGAIDGCARSPFHMGQNERNRKYNGLSQILRGKRGKRTVREHIQFMLDLRDQPGSTFIPSEAAAEIAEAKRNVRQGVAFGGSDMAKRQAQEAMEVLRGHGIETRVEETGRLNVPGRVTFIGG